MGGGSPSFAQSQRRSSGHIVTGILVDASSVAANLMVTRSVLHRAASIRSDSSPFANPLTAALCAHDQSGAGPPAGCELVVTKPMRLSAANVEPISKVSESGSPHYHGLSPRKDPSSHCAVSPPRSARVRTSAHGFITAGSVTMAPYPPAVTSRT